jgi:hypothetical protein
MALRGPWIKIADPLFIHRDHASRYTRAILADRKAASHWQDTSKRPKAILYYPTIYGRYWRIVRRNVKTRRQRLACYAELLRWWLTDNHTRAVASDLLLAISPTTLLFAQKIKRAFLGISHHPADLPPL